MNCTSGCHGSKALSEDQRFYEASTESRQRYDGRRAIQRFVRGVHDHVNQLMLKHFVHRYLHTFLRNFLCTNCFSCCRCHLTATNADKNLIFRRVGNWNDQRRTRGAVPAQLFDARKMQCTFNYHFSRALVQGSSTSAKPIYFALNWPKKAACGLTSKKYLSQSTGVHLAHHCFSFIIWWIRNLTASRDSAHQITQLTEKE